MSYIVKILVVAFFVLSSCTKPQYIEVEKIVDRYHHTTDTVSLTEKIRDSIIITQKGDTVFKDRWHTEYIDKWRMRVDSFIQHDTIPKPYPIEKDLSKWQKMKIKYGELSIFAFFVMMAVCIIKVSKK